MKQPSKKPIVARKLWFLKPDAGTLKSGQWILESDGPDWDGTLGRRCRECKRMRPREWPKSPPAFVYERVLGVPDIRWTFGTSIDIVSARFRECIELAHPGAAEFLPVTVSGPGRGQLPEYWAVNWLSAWNCQPDPDVPELDADAVPKSGGFGIVQGLGAFRGEIVVDAQTKRLLMQQQFRGVRFVEARIASGPDSPAHRAIGTRFSGKPTRQLDPIDRHFDVAAFFGRFPKGKGYTPQFPNSSALLDYVTARQDSSVGQCDVRVLRRFLAEGLTPNVGGDALEGSSPLAVVICPKSDAILTLLHEYGTDWNATNSIGLTPLMSAAMSESVATISKLIQLGADPRARTLDGMTALHFLLGFGVDDIASANRLIKAASVLVAAGTPINAETGRHTTALDEFDQYCSGRECESRARKQLIKLGAASAQASKAATRQGRGAKQK